MLSILFLIYKKYRDYKDLLNFTTWLKSLKSNFKHVHMTIHFPLKRNYEQRRQQEKRKREFYAHKHFLNLLLEDKVYQSK